MIYHTTLLLSVAWALLIFYEKQVYCGIIAVSSSSSQSETFCNGMRCPPGSSCAISVIAINGNKTSDTSCSNNGEVVRREIITESNGKRCIKNLTMTGVRVNVEQSCRNLSKAEIDYMEQNQKAIKVAMEERSKLYEEKLHELERRIKKETEALKMQAQALKHAAKARAAQLKARLAEMQRKLEAKFG